jgi:hypothetical protein
MNYISFRQIDRSEIGLEGQAETCNKGKGRVPKEDC